MVAIFPPKLSLHNRFRTWTFLAYIWPFSYMYGNIMRQVYYSTYRSCIGAKMVTFSIPYYNHPVQDSLTRPFLRGHRRGQPARLRTQAARRSTLKRPRQQTTFTFLFFTCLHDILYLELFVCSVFIWTYRICRLARLTTCFALKLEARCFFRHNNMANIALLFLLYH